MRFWALSVVCLLTVAGGAGGTNILFSGKPADVNRIVSTFGDLIGADDNAVVTAGMITGGDFKSLVGTHGATRGGIGHPDSPILDGLWLGEHWNNSSEATEFDSQYIAVLIEIDWASAVFTTNETFPLNKGGAADSKILSLDSVTGVVPEMSSPGASYGDGFLVIPLFPNRLLEH